MLLSKWISRTNSFSRLLALIFFSLIVIEVLYHFIPAAGRVGVIFWVFSSFPLIGFAGYSFWHMIRNSVKEKTFFTLFIVFFMLGTVFVYSQDVKSLNRETVIEVNCVLDQISKNTIDWGFGKTCHLGYPIRPFYLSSIPTLIFGRTFLTLHAGQSIYFVLGIVIFSAGILNYLRERKERDIIAATILTFIFHIYFFNYFMFIYEQSIFPFSLALTLVGLFFFFEKTHKLHYLLLSGIVLLYTIFAYTPSLALFFLALTILIYYLFTLPSQVRRISIAVLISTLFLVFILSLTMRSDLKFTEPGRPIGQVYNDLLQTLNHVFIQPQGTRIFVSPYFMLFFTVILMLGLLFGFGWKIFVITLWILGVIIVSGISKGFSFYSINFRVHRATVIFPVLFAIIAYIIRHTTLPFIKGKRILYFVAFFFFFTSGFLFQNKYLSERMGTRNAALIVWLQNKLPRDFSSKKSNIFLDKNLTHYNLYGYDGYWAFFTYASYFMPNMQGTIVDESCVQLPTNSQGETILYITSTHINTRLCFAKIMRNVDYLGTFNFHNDAPLNIYKIKKANL